MFQVKRSKGALFFLLSILAGCAHRQKKIKSQYLSHQNHVPKVELQETVARLTQIPDTPLSFEIFDIVADLELNHNVQLAYKLPKKNSMPIDLNELQKHYEINMEILGWNCINRFNSGKTMLLFFSRPGGYFCQVSFDVDQILRVTLLQGGDIQSVEFEN